MRNVFIVTIESDGEERAFTSEDIRKAIAAKANDLDQDAEVTLISVIEPPSA